MTEPSMNEPTMTEPVTPPVAGTPRSNAPVVLRIIFAVIFLVPAVIGLGVILVISGSFASEGFAFSGSDEVWMQLFIGAGAVLTLLPAIAIGIILRFARWNAAPQASLAVAIIVCGAGALASGMLQTTVTPGDSESYVLLMFFSVMGVVIGALPPFLHWWNARE